jgi:hypothetical protein
MKKTSKKKPVKKFTRQYGPAKKAAPVVAKIKKPLSKKTRAHLKKLHAMQRKAKAAPVKKPARKVKPDAPGQTQLPLAPVVPMTPPPHVPGTYPAINPADVAKLDRGTPVPLATALPGEEML